MQYNIQEAMMLFARKVDMVIEFSEGLKMGSQLLQALQQRNTQLEQFILANNLQVPPPPSGTEGSAPISGQMPANMTPLRQPPPSAGSAPPGATQLPGVSGCGDNSKNIPLPGAPGASDITRGDMPPKGDPPPNG